MQWMGAYDSVVLVACGVAHCVSWLGLDTMKKHCSCKHRACFFLQWVTSKVNPTASTGQLQGRRGRKSWSTRTVPKAQRRYEQGTVQSTTRETMLRRRTWAMSVGSRWSNHLEQPTNQSFGWMWTHWVKDTYKGLLHHDLYKLFCLS